MKNGSTPLPLSLRTLLIDEGAFRLHAQRQRGASVPEGMTMHRGWMPSYRENVNRSAFYAEEPSRRNHYRSFYNRCLTYDHCHLLMMAAVSGDGVPDDVSKILKEVWDTVAVGLACDGYDDASLRSRYLHEWEGCLKIGGVALSAIQELLLRGREH